MNRDSAPLRGLRVLVVEDELLIADHIEGLLAGLGSEIAGPVPTIDEALAVVLGGGIDGVLLDANLRGESSAPVADELRRRGVPFVVVTGYSGLEIAADVLNNAPRLAKPFSDGEFEATVTAALFPSA